MSVVVHNAEQAGVGARVEMRARWLNEPAGCWLRAGAREGTKSPRATAFELRLLHAPYSPWWAGHSLGGVVGRASSAEHGDGGLVEERCRTVQWRLNEEQTNPKVCDPDNRDRDPTTQLSGSPPGPMASTAIHLVRSSQTGTQIDASSADPYRSLPFNRPLDHAIVWTRRRDHTHSAYSFLIYPKGELNEPHMRHELATATRLPSSSRVAAPKPT